MATRYANINSCEENKATYFYDPAVLLSLYM